LTKYLLGLFQKQFTTITMSRTATIISWPLLLLLRLFLSLVLLLLLIVGGILYVYRFIISLLAQVLCPEFGAIVNPLTDYYFPINTKCNVTIKFKFSGNLQLERSVEKIKEKCILLKNETGDLVYPEFQQYLTTWGGYPFWRKEVGFCMAQHVEHVIMEQEKDVDDEVMKALQTVFNPQRSPWKITFFEIRDNREAYYLCFTFHHSLADGASIFSALIRAADSEVQPVQMRQKRTSYWTQLQLGFNTFLSCFNFLYDMLLKKETECWDIGDWSESRFASVTDEIPLEDLKGVGRKLDVSVSMVLFYLVTGAIRRKMLHEKVALPNTVGFLHPLYVADHPTTLTNKV